MVDCDSSASEPRGGWRLMSYPFTSLFDLKLLSKHSCNSRSTAPFVKAAISPVCLCQQYSRMYVVITKFHSPPSTPPYHAQSARKSMLWKTMRKYLRQEYSYLPRCPREQGAKALCLFPTVALFCQLICQQEHLLDMLKVCTEPLYGLFRNLGGESRI